MLKLHEKKQPLPPTWYIQADNCGKEVKNTTVMTFLCFLVQVSYISLFIRTRFINL
jgi:hypothetical protein